MIIDPDFLDHWRTRMVVDALGGDEMAPMYIMRLWAHCQSRKSDRHAMPPAGLKAQCRAPHEAGAFEQALTEAGFVERDGKDVVVLGWAEQNASLLAAWENGAKGGRPKKEPKENPPVPNKKPTGNPAETHGEPDANPGETDKSREEKNSPSLRSGEKGARAPALPKPEGVEDQTWTDWLQMRKKHRADVTPTVLKEAHREAEKAGMPLQRFLEIWCLRGSRGLQAEWLRADERRPAPATSGKHSGFADKNYREGLEADGSFH